MYRVVFLVLLAAVVLGGLFLALRPGPAAAPQEQNFDVAIKDGAMTPSEITANEGDRVTLQITSQDRAEVHLHGYDLEKEVGPDGPATLSFEANTTGRFDIEDHDTGKELGTLTVEPR